MSEFRVQSLLDPEKRKTGWESPLSRSQRVQRPPPPRQNTTASRCPNCWVAAGRLPPFSSNVLPPAPTPLSRAPRSAQPNEVGDSKFSITTHYYFHNSTIEQSEMLRLKVKAPRYARRAETEGGQLRLYEQQHFITLLVRLVTALPIPSPVPRENRAHRCLLSCMPPSAARPPLLHVSQPPTSTPPAPRFCTERVVKIKKLPR